jgi:isocitrate dehydrogenase kinase/phosphatase
MTTMRTLIVTSTQRLTTTFSDKNDEAFLNNLVARIFKNHQFIDGQIRLRQSNPRTGAQQNRQKFQHDKRQGQRNRKRPGKNGSQNL